MPYSTSRSLPVELAGLICSCLVGAAIALMIPIKGVAIVANAVMFAVLGAIIWTRRRETVYVTFLICGVVLVIGWLPTALVLSVLHSYINS